MTKLKETYQALQRCCICSNYSGILRHSAHWRKFRDNNREDMLGTTTNLQEKGTCICENS